MDRLRYAVHSLESQVLEFVGSGQRRGLLITPTTRVALKLIRAIPDCVSVRLLLNPFDGQPAAFPGFLEDLTFADSYYRETQGGGAPPRLIVTEADVSVEGFKQVIRWTDR
jgi:hypothetical protein